MIAVIYFARKWNKTAYYLFSGYYLWRTENFRENHFLSGFLDFFVNISTNIDKKVAKPLEKVDFLKFPVLPCSTLKRVISILLCTWPWKIGFFWLQGPWASRHRLQTDSKGQNGVHPHSHSARLLEANTLQVGLKRCMLAPKTVRPNIRFLHLFQRISGQTDLQISAHVFTANLLNVF